MDHLEHVKIYGMEWNRIQYNKLYLKWLTKENLVSKSQSNPAGPSIYLLH